MASARTQSAALRGLKSVKTPPNVRLIERSQPTRAPVTSVGSGVIKSGGVIQTAPQPSRGGGGDGGGSSDSGGGGRSEERYWWQPNWQDSAYNSQLAAVNRALADYETELGLQSERYGTDFLKGVRDLGYRPSEEFKPSVDIFSLPGMSQTGASGASALSTLRSAIAPTIQKAVGTEPVQGTWDYEGQFDPYSAAARGTRTSRDEFAGRGTLRSSDFAKAYDAFQRRMQDQLGAMQTGRTRYFEDAAIELAKERASAEERRQAARVNAMARAAAQGEYRTR